MARAIVSAIESPAAPNTEGIDMGTLLEERFGESTIAARYSAEYERILACSRASSARSGIQNGKRERRVLSEGKCEL